MTPFDVIQKQSQYSQNVEKKARRIVDFNSMVSAFFLSLFKNAPKTTVKYIIYEILMGMLSPIVPLGIAGGISGGIAALISTIVMTPIDVIRTRVLLKRYHTSSLFSGAKYSVILSVASNALGHGLLEVMGAR